MLTLTCLLVQVLAKRTEDRVPTLAGAEEVVPLPERVPGTLVLGWAERGGTLALAVRVAPDLVRATVCLALLAAAPAGALVVLQLYLTAHLKQHGVRSPPQLFISIIT